MKKLIISAIVLLAGFATILLSNLYSRSLESKVISEFQCVQSGENLIECSGVFVQAPRGL